jgi:hypothetical protein
MGAGSKPKSPPPDAHEVLPQQWDFFVSYTEADARWAKWIAWELVEAGYRVWYAGWHIVPGNVWPAEMDVGIRNSARTIAVLTPNYLQNSAYGKTEWMAAYRVDPEGAKRKLIPIVVREHEREGILGSIRSINLLEKPEDEARDLLLEGIDDAVRGSAVRTRPAFPGSTVVPVERPVQRRPVVPPPFPGPKPRWQRIRELLRKPAVLATVAGLVFVSSQTGTLLHWRPWIGPLGECVPTELRLGVTPSIANALTSARPGQKSWRDAFEESTDDGCHSTHLYVYPVDDLTMADALRQDWSASSSGNSSFQLIGPQPDAWIASSSLAVERARASGPGRVPDTYSRLGGTPIVPLIPTTAAAALPSPLTAQALAKALTTTDPNKKLALRRPDPDSGAGLVSLLSLYRGVTHGALTKHTLDTNKGDLGLLESRTVPSSCGTPDASASPPVVTLIPKNQIAAAGCTGSQAQPDASLGSLDYPFVALRDTAERSDAVAALRRFLTGPGAAQFRRENGLDPATGAPSVDTEADEVSAVITERKSFRPPVNVLFALDVSASMRSTDPGFSGHSKTWVAAEAVGKALSLANQKDHIAAWEFAGASRPAMAFEEGTPTNQRFLTGQLFPGRGGLTGGTAIFNTLAKASDSAFRSSSGSDPNADRVVILLTDGQDQTSDVQQWAKKAASRINADAGPRVFLLSIGGDACRGVSLGTKAACYPLNNEADLASAIDRIAGQLWGGV